MNAPHLPIPTALCSYGMSGKVFHGPLLEAHPGFDLQIVLQRSREDALDDFPDVKIVRSLDEILHDPHIELVIVNTPDHTHYELCKAVLEAGKHVVVEKAFTPTLAEAQSLITLAEQQQKQISVYHNRRWDGDFLTVQQVIAQKLLGRLVEFEAHYDRYRTYIQDSWKEETGPGSGLLYNLGSHLIDQALVLFGRPQGVFADLSIQREGGKIYDDFHVHLYYPGLKAILKSSYLVREAGPRYRVLGEQGSFYKWGLDPQEEALKRGEMPGSEGWGIEAETDWGHLHTETNGLVFKGRVPSLPGNYMAYYDNIYAALREGAPLAVTARQAADVIQVIECAQKSAETRKVVPFA